MESERAPAPVSEIFLLLMKYTLTPCISCFGHVVNLANVAVMSHITKIAAVENANAIWEYDPALPGNRVLNGSLDVIASIRTIAIKVSDHFVYLFIHHITLLDTGLWSTNRTLRKTSNPMQDHRPTQNPPP
jgi:hypothetical protein